MNKKSIVAAFLLVVIFCSFILEYKPNINIVFIGDSITAGPAPNISPPKFAGDYLRQQPGLGNVQVSNMGMSGFTTVNFLPGHQTFAKVKAAAAPFYADTKAILVFSVMLGTNDSAIKGPAGSPVAPVDYRANLKTIADSLFAAYPNCKIVVNYPLWYSENTHNSGAAYMKEGQARVILYKKEIDTLVDAYKKEKPRRLFMGDKQAYDYFRENCTTDFSQQTGPDGPYYLHPNEKGDKDLAEFWSKAILKVIHQTK